MSILSWLKTVTHGGNTADLINQPLTFGAGEEEFQGLNMKDALDAHTQWTHRLEAILNGTSNETLEVGTVAADCHCALGHWIHGHAKQNFSNLSEYDELKRKHAEFHLTAGEVLNNVQNGEGHKASEGLRKIRGKSGEVQIALIRLYSVAR